MKKIAAVLRSLGAAEKILLGIAIGVLLLIGVGVANSPSTTDTSTKKPIATSKPKTHTPKITYQTVVEKQDIPFGSTTTQSSSLSKGTTKVTTTGVNGTKSLTYKVTFSDGNQTKKELVKEEIIVQPVTQVTTVGTYVAPPPPPSPPAQQYPGATAICSDGTPSYSAHHQGTCSHHGGVARWL
jgi:hypothetical protein